MTSIPTRRQGNSLAHSINKRLGLLGMVLAMVMGCNSQDVATSTPNSTLKSEPSPSRGHSSLEDIAKDVKPPVIIKPNVPSPTGTEPNGPARNPT